MKIIIAQVCEKDVSSVWCIFERPLEGLSAHTRENIPRGKMMEVELSPDEEETLKIGLALDGVLPGQRFQDLFLRFFHEGRRFKRMAK